MIERTSESFQLQTSGKQNNFIQLFPYSYRAQLIVIKCLRIESGSGVSGPIRRPGWLCMATLVKTKKYNDPLSPEILIIRKYLI